MEQVSLIGALLAFVFYAISVSPSLLPRRWWWQAFVSGALMGLGYAIGAALSTLVGFILEATGVEVSSPEATVEVAKYALVIAVGLWTSRSVILAFRDSKRAAALTGMKPVKLPEYLVGIVSTALMFATVLAILDMLLRIFNQIVSLLALWMYFPLAVLLSIISVIVLVFVVSNKVVFKAILLYFGHLALKMDKTPTDNLVQPLVPERSGSPDSYTKWESVGSQGRLFLGLGPSASELSEITKRPAIEPVRAYVGIDGARPDLNLVAEKAVEELRRAGGFERAAIVVNTATGSGWVDQWLVQPVEYLTGGNCATVSMQYSYLFSAALMISDLESCKVAGTALFEAVERAVLEMPPERRPLIFVTGESLGAYGSQAPFKDLEDLNRRTDGAIWAGPPFGSHLSLQLTNGRHKGSPEVAPVFGSGRHARFVNTPTQLDADLFGREFGPWEFPRSVFVQHASDPVVWFTKKLLFQEPDWLRERAGLDVSPAMRYTPIATYLQVMTDLPVAGLAPPGHGHTYHRELIEAWARVLGFDMPEACGRIGDTGWLTEEMKNSIGAAIERDHLRAERRTDIQRAERTVEGTNPN